MMLAIENAAAIMVPPATYGTVSVNLGSGAEPYLSCVTPVISSCSGQNKGVRRDCLRETVRNVGLNGAEVLPR
jgi:hypothetical protein